MIEETIYINTQTGAAGDGTDLHDRPVTFRKAPAYAFRKQHDGTYLVVERDTEKVVGLVEPWQIVGQGKVWRYRQPGSIEVSPGTYADRKLAANALILASESLMESGRA